MDTTLPLEVYLNGGRRGQWVWRYVLDSEDREVAVGSVPVGVLMDHDDHTLLVPWAHYDGGPERVFLLDSLLPLTVVGQIDCSICGDSGRIEQGAWLPAKGGDGR